MIAHCTALVSSAGSRALDGEASAQWGLDHFALVEAAGRACAQVFARACLRKRRTTFSVALLAGGGNNAADALVMLKALILGGYAQAADCVVFTTKAQGDKSPEGRTPLGEAMLSVQKLGVAVSPWEAGSAALGSADVIIDGIAGTGLNGPLRGAALEMAEAVNSLRQEDRPLVVSIDLPSGNFDGWRPGMAMVNADATLAIEPQKLCLYTPAARLNAGKILHVGGIFPPALIEKYREANFFTWENAAALIPPVSPTAYKYERGLIEIRAGSPGATGAAQLAAMGAQAAGAGLVRLIVDPSLYPLVAPACTGIMVVPGGEAAEEKRFSPAAVLLGPGWGKGEDRGRLMETYLPQEERGLPLVLDADAIGLAKGIVFHGNAILTPHPGEFASYSGLPKDEILADPVPALRRIAKEKNAVLLFKSHVLYAAAPDGRIGVIDGMNPALAAGGSGDVLAGFCAAIAGRLRAGGVQGQGGDTWHCACAAAALLVRAAKEIAGRFADPAELADAAADIAGAAWLPPAFTGGKQ
ncbi:MAG: hypothetical protein LBQ69_05945 [Treponema sp.]|nr:hypothetical protein [Treponema sp.]